MRIDRLYIDQALPGDDEIGYLISKLDIVPEYVAHPRTVYKYIHSGKDPVRRAKHTLFVTRNRGAVIRECPGTRIYTCCDYTILHSGTFCTMDCSYCILQTYFHPPVLQYFAGLDMLKAALYQKFSEKKIFRIGTGEFTDSLIWEPVSLMPRFLVETFAKQEHCVLELKTKTVHIDSLLEIDHHQKTILAWSLNTPEIIRSQERGTASLKARLQAAKRAESCGYRLAFHFDPLVIYPGCEDSYQKVIDLMFTYVKSDSIVWISLGTFRFMPDLKQVIEKRFPGSAICYGEFILGLDNKMRYFKPLRIKLYQALVARLKKYAPKLPVYFCMEDETVWQKCMGFFPGKPGELGHLLDRSAAEKCGLHPAGRTRNA